MKAVGFGTLAFVVALAAGCDRRSPEAAFTERVAAELRRVIPKDRVQVTAPKTLQVRYSGGTIATLSLDNLWLDCSRQPDTCERSIERFVRVSAEGQGFASALPRRETLRATLKGRSWLDESEKQGVKVVSRPFAGDLWTVYLFDLPDGLRMLTSTDIASLKLNESEIDALALANLDKALPEFPCEPLAEGSPIWLLHAGDSYEASRLLLHDRWRPLAARVQGDLLVTVPSRDFVFFVGSGERAETLKAFQTLTETMSRKESHSVSPQILRWTPAGWELYPRGR